MTITYPTAQTRSRILSIDIVRGLIMIIMTLDHTRDFLMLPGPSPLAMKTAFWREYEAQACRAKVTRAPHAK